MDELLQFPAELLEQFFPGGFTLRDEANAIVAWVLRNGPLEDLHTGETFKLLEDDSLSRMTDTDMKEVMRHCSKQLEELLRLKETDPKEYYKLVKSFNIMYCRQWGSADRAYATPTPLLR